MLFHGLVEVFACAAVVFSWANEVEQLLRDRLKGVLVQFASTRCAQSRVLEVIHRDVLGKRRIFRQCVNTYFLLISAAKIFVREFKRKIWSSCA